MAPKWRHGSIPELNMGVSLSIKDVPEALAERLRRRAEANHRSLQGELMAIIERAAAEGSTAAGSARALPAAARRGPTKSIEQIAAEHLARHPEPFFDVPRAVDIIRDDRDDRDGR
jgi:plasmid stability protein